MGSATIPVLMNSNHSLTANNSRGGARVAQSAGDNNSFPPFSGSLPIKGSELDSFVGACAGRPGSSAGFLMAFLLACATALQPTRCDDWPVYQHDNRRSGASSENLPVGQLAEAWAYHSPNTPQQAWFGPAKWDAYAGIRGLKSMRNYDPVFHVTVVGQSLFFASSTDDSVHCVDSRSAVEKWTFTTDGPVRIAPSYSDGRLYFGSDDGNAYCVDAETGTLIWRHSPSPESRLTLHNGRFISFWPCRTGVLVDGGIAYFATGLLPWKESYLCAVDALTGKPEGIGRFIRRLEGVTFEGSLLASSQKLISPQGRVAPLLFDRSDGNPLGGLEGGGGCFVLVTEDSRVFHGPGNKTGWIQESNEKDRSKIATIEGGNAMIVRGDTAFVLTDDTIIAMDRAKQRELWRHSGRYPYSLILAGDALYAGGKDTVIALSADDGRVLWQGGVAGRAHGLAVADGALFVSTDQGVIHSFRGNENEGGRISSGFPNVSKIEEKLAPSQPVPPISDPDLLGRWVFQEGLVEGRRVKNLAGKQDGAIIGKTALVSAGRMQVLQLSGKAESVLVTANLKSADLPREKMTAEAWVRINRPLEWGGIVGAIQDDGDTEHGWLLGYRNSKFCFAIAGEQGSGRLTYLTAKSDFELGQWHHVMGTYDGTEARLYVNGILDQKSSEQRGAIRYPDRGYYEIGAYHDSDEHYRMSGMLREVRVFGRSLSATEASEHAKENSIEGNRKIQLAAGPILEFVGLDQAVVRWETETPLPTLLEWSSEEGESHSIADNALKTHHEAALTGLKHQRVYEYRIKALVEGRLVETEVFECDTFFNYNLPPIAGDLNPFPNDGKALDFAETARRMLDESGVSHGICLMLGCENSQLAFELAKQSQMRVVAVGTDLAQVRAAREALKKTGAYGVRVSVRWVPSYSDLPFTRRSLNLIVLNPSIPMAEATFDARTLAELLRPDGGVAVLRIPSEIGATPKNTLFEKWIERAQSVTGVSGRYEGDSLKLVRAAFPGAGEWSHQYGKADNSAFGGESLMGASRTEEFDVQWMGRPGPRAQPDRNGRKPSPLSASGRLFVQGLQRVIGLDAHNGTILWSREIPAMQRFNMPRDCSNWCADADHVFIAINDRCWRFDAASGTVSKQYSVTPGDRNGRDYDWSYVSVQGEQLIGSAVTKGTAYTDYWGGSDSGWYDATSGPATYKVCSEHLFGLDLKSGAQRWIYRKGMIINSTISIGDEGIFFIENRNKEVATSDSYRIGMPELWNNLFLVKLDLRDGSVIWEKPISPAAGEVVFYLAYGKDALALVASGAKAYHVYSFSPADGETLWQTSFPWAKDNHGGHMARPAIVGKTLFVRPQVFDLVSGELKEETIPGGGCGTYAATLNALFFRNSNVTVWSASGGEATSWSRLRPDCWLSTIPAAGLLLSPEAGGGCSCGSWMETSLAFAPIPGTD